MSRLTYLETPDSSNIIVLPIKGQEIEIGAPVTMYKNVYSVPYFEPFYDLNFKFNGVLNSTYYQVFPFPNATTNSLMQELSATLGIPTTNITYTVDTLHRWIYFEIVMPHPQNSLVFQGYSFGGHGKAIYSSTILYTDVVSVSAGGNVYLYPSQMSDFLAFIETEFGVPQNNAALFQNNSPLSAFGVYVYSDIDTPITVPSSLSTGITVNFGGSNGQGFQNMTLSVTSFQAASATSLGSLGTTTSFQQPTLQTVHYVENQKPFHILGFYAIDANTPQNLVPVLGFETIIPKKVVVVSNDFNTITTPNMFHNMVARQYAIHGDAKVLENAYYSSRLSDKVNIIFENASDAGLYNYVLIQQYQRERS